MRDENDPRAAAEAQTRDVRRLSASLPRVHDITSLSADRRPTEAGPDGSSEAQDGAAWDGALTGDGARVRLVVATDWSTLSVPLATLSAYAHMVPPHAPVDLVFAVPHLPGPRDEDNVRSLLHAIDDRSAPAGLRVESFEEAAEAACFAAVVPAGDPDLLVVELSTALMAMHALARWADAPLKRGLSETFLERPALLRARLERFREPDGF